MPDIAYGDADWVAIRPGTDGAFVASLINEMITQGTADLSFIEKHTNGAYLIKEDGQPLTQSDICSNGSKSMYVVMDSKGNISFRGLKKNEKGIVVGFDEDPAFKEADLNAGSTVKLADGTSIPVKSAFVLCKRENGRVHTGKTSEITGIPAGTIRRIAKEFADFKGVIDDGWYSSKNGTDVQLYQLISIANAINGNIDAKGGLVVTAGAGLKVPSVSAGKRPER